MTENKYPRVSVVISTYNRPERLDKALASVHAQTFKDFEVVVVDDCSPDEKAVDAVLDEWHPKFAERGVCLGTYRMPQNSAGRQGKPKNAGINRSGGDYIAYLDDDNRWRPDHLQACVDAIEADFSTDLVYTRLCYEIDGDADLRAFLTQEFGGKAPEGDTPGQPWNPGLLERRNYIDTSTILHSRGALYRMVRDTNTAWDERKPRMADWNFVYRWAACGLTGKLVDKVTVDYVWHKGSMQVSRPLLESPVCTSFSEWLKIRKTLPT